MSPATALDGPTHRHGQSGVGLLHPADSGVGWVAAAASVPDVDVGIFDFGPTLPSLIAWLFWSSGNALFVETVNRAKDGTKLGYCSLCPSARMTPMKLGNMKSHLASAGICI